MTFGQTVRSVRQKVGRTLRQTARVVKISAPHLSDIEHDRRLPSDDVVDRLTAVLNFDFRLAKYQQEADELVRLRPEMVEFLKRHRPSLHNTAGDLPARLSALEARMGFLEKVIEKLLTAKR
jgi:transcriptional regulator with XRE-family HTH domain